MDKKFKIKSEWKKLTLSWHWMSEKLTQKTDKTSAQIIQKGIITIIIKVAK
jgi:hypothetical protein